MEYSLQKTDVLHNKANKPKTNRKKYTVSKGKGSLSVGCVMRHNVRSLFTLKIYEK